jgi:hypothetical protein
MFYRIIFFVFCLSIFSSCKKDYPAEFYEAELSSRFTYPTRNVIFNHNITYELKWTGLSANEIAIYLFQEDDLILTISPKEENNNYYFWNVPITAPANNNYRFKIVALGGSSIEFFSPIFTIEGDSTTPYITPQVFINNNSFLRGMQMNINFTTNVSNNPIAIELFNGNQSVALITDSAVSNNFDWTIPSNLANSSDYRLYYYVKNQPDVNNFSSKFRISDIPFMNLVKNGDFNTNEFWQISNPNANVTNRWNINNSMVEGQAELISLTTTGSMFQSVNIISGQQYVVTYTLKSLGGYFGGAKDNPSGPFNNNQLAGIRCFLGNNSGVKRVAEGTYSDTITANGNEIRFVIIQNLSASPSTGLIGVLDDVFLVPLN